MYVKFQKKEIPMGRMSNGQRAGEISFTKEDFSYFETIGGNLVVKMNCGEKIILDITEEEFKSKINK